MGKLKDVETRVLRDELERRELSSISEALYQKPVEVEDYNVVRKHVRTYMILFRRLADPLSKARRVALLFWLLDGEKDSEKASVYKHKLDQEFSCMMA